jgi:mono/diheme cytochrome c family protein
VAAGCLFALAVGFGVDAQQPTSTAPASAVIRQAATTGDSLTAADYQALVGKYCVTCHNNRLRTGEVTFEGVDFANVSEHAETLEKAVRKLLVGAMPPPGSPRPAPAVLHALGHGLESELEAAAARKSDPGRAILRRLNRTEYANAIRDLLDLDVDVSTLLPVDNSSYGFDNIADVLGMSPVLMERYLTAARRISALAIGNPDDIPTTADTYRVRPDLSQDRHIEGLPLGTRGGLLVKHTFPVDAEYIVKVDLLQATLNNVVGLEFPHTVVITVDGVEVHRATIGGREDLVTSYANSQGTAELLESRLVVRLPVKAGPRRVAASFIEKSAAVTNGLLQPYLRTTFEPTNYTGQPHLEALVVTGPFNATGAGDTPSRRRIFQCRPKTAADETACATRILSTIARRAYRRPLVSRDVQTLLRFYEMGRTPGGFERGVQMGVRRILASPDFVLRVERDPAGVKPGTARRVSDLELAARLSFFLWSTIPDDQLLNLAISGRLSQPAVLEQQVRRMLADRRSRALVDNFAGQWLYLRNLRNINPDVREFPDFDDNLRTAMRTEVELLFETIVKEDRSVMDLMTAEYTFINERLAKHYGIPRIYGDHYRRVALTDEERYGLLGKGAILMVTSYATRTSPVIRGRWILENIIGTPPHPPPPDVPALEDNVAGQKPKTLRQRLEVHRENAVCASCHRTMDPIGFALEPFDAVGQWRTNDLGSPIDATGQLMDGTTVNGPSTLRRALSRNPEVFVRTMTEKMLTYARGRGRGPADMAAVRTVTRAARVQNYRFSSVVLGIVDSVPFRMKLASLDEHTDGADAAAR